MNRHLIHSDELPLFVPTNNAGYQKDAIKLHDIAVRAASARPYKSPKLAGEERATLWMKNHPEVYPLFAKFAAEVAGKRSRFSAKAIIERMRWETAVQGGSDFKIANAVTAYLARRFVQDYPEHGKLFLMAKSGGAK